jgi:hypothetical protein
MNMTDLRTRVSNALTLTLLGLLVPFLTACGGVSDSATVPTVITNSSPTTQQGPPDSTAPTITITSPTTGDTFTATTANITVTGSVTDDSGLSQLSWSNSLGGSGDTAVSGASVSQSFNVALHSGSNVLTFSARDTAGNTAKKVLTVSYSPSTPPNTASLAWDPPINTASITGYRVYFGTAPGTYQQIPGQGIKVGKVTNYTVLGLNSRTRYYFAVTAIDSSGNESVYSNEAYKDM